MTSREHNGAALHAVEPSSTRSVPGISLRTLLITCNHELGRQLRAVLEQGVSIELLSHLEGLPDSANLQAWLDHFEAQLVLVDISEDPVRGEQVIRQARALAPQARVVAVHTSMGSSMVVAMLRAGASDFWSAPFERDALKESVERMLRAFHAKRAGPGKPRGRVIAVTSVKPGSGASTIAAQTCFAISRITGERILLLDLNIQSGATALWLDQQETVFSTEQLLTAPEAVSDPRGWEDVTTTLHGVDFVPAPVAPEQDDVPLGNLDVILDSARRAYEYILLDLPTAAHLMALEAMARADEVLLATTGELTSLHLMQRSQGVLLDAGLSLHNVRCVVNRAREEHSIAVEYLQKSLKALVEITLPNDYFSLHAAGTPATPLVGDGRLVQGFRRLARQITDRRQASSVIPHSPPPVLQSALSA